ncbi:hypothetical protein C2S52_010017 [Perilla frutescens var. hirtella]|nr:hypothetical protein C2S52_010017 [Perilla frutescens var. hirtella]
MPCTSAIYLLGPRKPVKDQASFLAKVERQFFAQKAKIQHLNLANKGTKFFHSLVKRNSRRNFIAAITCSDGTFTTSPNQVAGEFVGYFMNLFGSHSPSEQLDPHILTHGRILTVEAQQCSSQPILGRDIKAALFVAIGDEKALGPDGFSAVFFKKSWNIVGPSICAALHEFFLHGRLLKHINNTPITLVPKTEHFLPQLSSWACCNVVYKIITKILAYRLDELLDGLIDHAQSAFIGGRSITDNVFLALELIRDCAKSRIKVFLCL